MFRLILFELEKIWLKKSFILAVLVLLILNIFILWYTNLPDEESCRLSSYKVFQNKISHMSEDEKAEYISSLKKTIDGVCFVQEVIDMHRLSDGRREIFARQAMEENPGVFDIYYDLYKSGDYLNFTDSIYKEKKFIYELYDEWEKVSGYDEYLESIQETKDILGGIGVFGGQDKDSYSSRNVEKSAKDYEKLTSEKIDWMPSKAVTHSMESMWTDILLLLSVFLFVGNLIFEEKEKRLFYITRNTRYGIVKNIMGKLISLLTHCIASSFLLYGANLIFFQQATGFGDMTAGIQSVAPYIESSLNINILEYILLSIFTKGLVIYGVGAIITALCIWADNVFMPYIAGILLCGVSYILYFLIPNGLTGITFKYLNMAGLLETESIYGEYLNFNIFGYPVSRLFMSWIIILLIAVTGSLLSVVLFAGGKNFELKSRRTHIHSFFRPHGNMFRHESYKIMVTSKASIVIFIFGIIIGYRVLSYQYNPSVQEQYYRDMMLKLEGELTDEKEEFILSEKSRYDEAFAEIENIDKMASDGEINVAAAENMKAQWYAVTAFYPSFQRVMLQYERILKGGGDFIYDTGYLYLFGKMNMDFVIDLLLLSFCMVFAFSDVIAMEYQNGSLNLISATLKGKRKIISHKTLICVITAAVVSLIPFICRIISISSVYPLHGWSFSVNDIPYCGNFPLHITVIGFTLLLAVSQAISLIAVTLVILLISYWRKNYAQTIFFAALILTIPIVLKLLGFSFAGGFSVYPLYSWSANMPI